MGNGYQVPAEGMEQLRQVLQDARARLRELEALDGSQIYNTVQDLKNLIAGLLDATDINVTGDITAGGTITANTAYNSLATYSRNVTGSGSYRVMYVNIAGEIGYVPSSRQFKRDIRELVPSDDILNLPVVEFRYKDAVENLGDDAPLEVGVIAEEVDEMGLSWLVDYDEAGNPFGFKYDRLALALLGAVKTLNDRVASLESQA